MTPPALKCSPGRELRSNNHKRGCSLESGLQLQEKDDDLALFNEMQTRERDNFLLDMTDDIDDSFYNKLGISIPVRGENSDLLIADSEKNDYEWLLTPPDTPLFPSLDDNTPAISPTPRGRSRTQPISISRSSTMEKSSRTSRSSASPHRLSPSPRSGSNTFQSRGRPSSAPHSSPSPIQRPASPSPRPITPPNKPITPARRSLTPTTRRTSTGSSGTIPSSRRGTSPVKTSRGNSASPKIQAWQSTIPGFSSDAPPNLRTSLADRPASYVRGSSPASRNGKDTPSQFRRQSMSPTASRSGSSSVGCDRDRFSSQSKGSVASSGDDDMDSLQSLPLSVLDQSAVRMAGAFPNSRALAFSRKPSKTPSSSSAPKRSFDSVLRQMDYRRSHQNMFRPLLSSVPSTTFYVGKNSSTHRSMVSVNSSVTTSSNASSEQGTSVAPDAGGSAHDQDDMAGSWGKTPFPEDQDEVFAFDKVDEMNLVMNDAANDGKNSGYSDFDIAKTTGVKSGDSEKFSSLISATAIESTTSEFVHFGNDSEVLDRDGRITYCSNCGSKFCVVEPTEENYGLCPDCSEKSGSLTPAAWEHTVDHSHNNKFNSEVTLQASKCFVAGEHEAEVALVPEINSRNETMLVQHDENVEKDHSCSIEEAQSCVHCSSFAQLMVDGGEQQFVQPTFGSIHSEYDNVDQQFQHSNGHPSLKIDVSEGTGISVLLKRSSRSKWPIVQARSLTATNIPCDDPSYARDSMDSMRSSGRLGSASASSSVDWTSSRQTEIRVLRQLSGRKIDLDNFRHDSSTKLQRTGSSSSGMSNPAYQALLLTKSMSEENFDASIGSMNRETLVKTLLVSDEKNAYLGNEKLGDSDSSFSKAAVLEADKLDCSQSCRVVDASGLELSSHTQCIQLGDASVAAVPNDEDCVSLEIAEDFPNSTRSASDIEISAMDPNPSSIEENATMNGDCAIEIVEGSSYDSSAMVLENGGDRIPGSQVESATTPNSSSAIDEFSKPSVPATLEKDAKIHSPESDILDHAYVIPEESNVTVEGQGGQKGRNLTLEEATDTILFCGSIIHDLAYQAATIAMEKESTVHLEGSHPTVTFLGKPSSERKDPRSRTGSKRTPKTQKARQRRVEADAKTTSTKTQIDANTNESLVHDSGAPHKVDSLKPLKLESKCNCTVM
ncbi:uncharacterized protein LOC122081877 isoform X2 [Macadamia integrifolia]|uniref:uncharacterized protein LOC122081877 isoform X2 n=1 Tax=Macadamia integrifolia TaxID=60698 RepID=UPI001C4F10A6|nr:uncharacterized protein LOC122081877 isoform X2 [Macadamia integrifolia]